VSTLHYFLIIIGILLLLFVLSRHLSLKKEIKKVKKQLDSYNKREGNKKIDIALIDQDLENLVAEINKLIDLHNLEKQKRMNTEAEQKKAIANMSHDLRTPLTSIQGYIQMAEKENLSSEERKELLQIASERAKRLEILLNDFFTLSMIEANDYEMTIERVNLRKITIEVLMSFYDRFQEKSLEPEIHLPEKDIFIMVDETAVMRVLENLISNALNHSDGGIAITLQEKDEEVNLIVSNNAFNLTEHDVQHLFDRFYMADRSRSKSSTGLGLSIAKSLMGKMDGNITAQLNEGRLVVICKWKYAK